MNSKYSLLSIYYATCLAVVSHGMSSYFGHDLKSMHWMGIFYPLTFLNLTVSFDVLFMAFVFTTLSVLWMPYRQSARVAHAVALLMLFSLFFSLGKGNFHSYHFFFYFSFFFIFMSTTNTFKKNKLVVTLLSGVILLNYTTSGLWKLYELFHDSSLSTLLFDLGNTFKYHFAYAKAEGSLRENFLQTLLMNHPFLSAISWLFVIFLELFSFIPLLKPDYLRPWALMMAGLHLMVGITMGIWFYSAIILLFILCGFHQQILASEP